MNKEEKEKKEEKLYDQILASATGLLVVVSTGSHSDEDRIRQLQSDTDAAVRELSGLLVLKKKWSFPVPEKPSDLNFKLQVGTIRSVFALNEKDLLVGCLNRMFVTDDFKEFEQFVHGLYHCVYSLVCLALESIGVLTISEYEPESIRLDF